MDEESSHASRAEVDLNKLFKHLRFEAGEELALSAGQPLSKASLPVSEPCVSISRRCCSCKSNPANLVAQAISTIHGFLIFGYKDLYGFCNMQVNRLRWRAGKRLERESEDEQDSQADFTLRTGMRWQGSPNEALVVELQPMEIRTFLLAAERQQAVDSGVAFATS